MKTQEDYIRGMLETRRACDQYAENLIPYKDTEVVAGEWDFKDMKQDMPRTYIQMLTDYAGITTTPEVLAAEVHEDEAPITFTYSLYYIYYDQYTYIRGVLFQNVVVALGAIIVAMQVISSLQSALIVGFCIFLVFFELMGVMWMMNIVIGGYPVEINAVFVVNLITSVGFGVEFCNHITMNFLKQQGTKTERAMIAMNNMGSSVVVGIASTKLLGIIVLAFAPSTLFRLYYFRMYLFIIILGCFNGLALLPIMLSLIGPEAVSILNLHLSYCRLLTCLPFLCFLQNEMEVLEKKLNTVQMRKAMENSQNGDYNRVKNL